MSTVGIVVVSHSPLLARAAVELGLEMVPRHPPRVVVAAGTSDGGTGTDATKVADAIAEAGVDGRGVLVFMDLGSAVLSAELALEFVGEVSGGVRLTSAPFVEGLLAAVVAAAAGQSLDDVEREALGALSVKSTHLDEHPAPVAAQPHAGVDAAHIDVDLVNRDGLHARPAALIVTALGSHDAELLAENLTRSSALVQVTGTTAILAMGGRQGDRIRFHARGAHADALLAAVRELVSSGFGESLDEATPAPSRTRPIGVSAGTAVGPVRLMTGPPAAPASLPPVEPGQRAADADRIGAAAADVAEDMIRRAGRALGEPREILQASARIVTDTGLLDTARSRVLAEGLPAAFAVWETFGGHADALRAHGGRIGERASDVEDARLRIVAALTGQAAPGLPDATEPYVLVARDLSPADTALLDRRACLALVTEEGGPTSHTAIIARALGIPAVVGAKGAWTAPQGTILLVDGSTGELVWDPRPDQAEEIEAARPAAREFDGRGVTADGRHVPLLANVGSAKDADAAAAARAEGVGLFRTEFCFLDRDDAPTIDEQVGAYRKVLAAFAGRRVVVRTLDAGSDKPLGFVPTAPEANPALGVRGYRTVSAHPELLDHQLTAIARAAELESADVAVMAPMIATVEEAVEFAASARSRGLRHVGVMIETPAAAIVADRLFEVVDFVSLGTNDLTQYTMAADRLVGDLAALNDPWQPAVLGLIARVGAAAAAAGKPVGVCGEAAADPLLAPVLVGAGATSLSMSARSLAGVAEMLRSVSDEQCRSAAAGAIAAASAADARTIARSVLVRTTGGRVPHLSAGRG
jgi:phosphotransferase system enzyme I (PtsI)